MVTPLRLTVPGFVVVGVLGVAVWCVYPFAVIDKGDFSPMPYFNLSRTNSISNANGGQKKARTHTKI